MDEEDRSYNFVPTAFAKIRHVPVYDKLIQERFKQPLFKNKEEEVKYRSSSLNTVRLPHS
jgi:hypothetical protein